MKKRLHFLLTNDDGIQAPGIYALWKSLNQAGIADISIVAPSVERSGTGAAITWDRPMLIKKEPWENSTPAWSVDGSPADCVKMALRVILDNPPDFIVSGVNAGSNAGRNVLHSGTIGAVIEGLLRGIPGVAFSCEDGDQPNFHVAEKYIPAIVEYLLENPLCPGSFLNVNFPHIAKEHVKGFRITRQGKGRWAEDPILHLNTEGGASYWMGGKPEEVDEEEDCDIALLREGYLTGVPIHVHELTDRDELLRHKEAFEAFLEQKKHLDSSQNMCSK